MKGIFNILFTFICLLSISMASVFSSTPKQNQVIGQYQCQGIDVYYKTKYVGGFTLTPATTNSDVLVYKGYYRDVGAHQQSVSGLGYLDGDILILSFRPNHDELPGAGSYRISAKGHYLAGKYIYLTDPDNVARAKVNTESCRKVDK
ncbi:MAG: hypothetical protein CMF39_05920 [Legionellaceae bacterium]|nr:hypothetical protein [Legionellaceae bacterium]|tara:strand:+ start:449 stop:889 length:441 start_codon:yes stop_codon:yes gene_type:complete